MNYETWEVVKIAVTVLSMIMIPIVGWWCVKMSSDIEKLRASQTETSVTIMQIRTANDGREKLQDERWKNLTNSLHLLQTLIVAGHKKHSHIDQVEEEQPQT